MGVSGYLNLDGGEIQKYQGTDHRMTLPSFLPNISRPGNASRLPAVSPHAFTPRVPAPTRSYFKMDIDDLLQEFEDKSVPAGTRDINDLTQAWIAERTAPEILPYQNDLLERLMERIRAQVR